jgi:hypothetical protein
MREKAHGKAEIRKMQVYEWHKHFRNVHASANDEQQCERLLTLIKDKNMDSMYNVTYSDHRNSIQEVSAEV